MAFNEFLADCIRRIFNEKSTAFEEKKMMGGLCFLVDGKQVLECRDIVAVAKSQALFYSEF